MRRSDLVGRDIVAQLGIIRRILRIPGQIFARELPLDQFRIFGEKKNASPQPDFVRPLFDFAFQKRVDHVEPVGIKGFRTGRLRLPSPVDLSIVTRGHVAYGVTAQGGLWAIEVEYHTPIDNRTSRYVSLFAVSASPFEDYRRGRSAAPCDLEHCSCPATGKGVTSPKRVGTSIVYRFVLPRIRQRLHSRGPQRFPRTPSQQQRLVHQPVRGHRFRGCSIQKARSIKARHLAARFFHDQHARRRVPGIEIEFPENRRSVPQATLHKSSAADPARRTP
jgi:hypothetical protein